MAAGGHTARSVHTHTHTHGTARGKRYLLLFAQGLGNVAHDLAADGRRCAGPVHARLVHVLQAPLVVVRVAPLHACDWLVGRRVDRRVHGAVGLPLLAVKAANVVLGQPKRAQERVFAVRQLAVRTAGCAARGKGAGRSAAEQRHAPAAHRCHGTDTLHGAGSWKDEETGEGGGVNDAAGPGGVSTRTLGCVLQRAHVPTRQGTGRPWLRLVGTRVCGGTCCYQAAPPRKRAAPQRAARRVCATDKQRLNEGGTKQTESHNA